MNTHNLHDHDKIRQFPLNYVLIFVFLRYRKNFLRTQKRVRIRHSKRVICVRRLFVYGVDNLRVRYCCVHVSTFYRPWMGQMLFSMNCLQLL